MKFPDILPIVDRVLAAATEGLFGAAADLGVEETGAGIKLLFRISKNLRDGFYHPAVARVGSDHFFRAASIASTGRPPVAACLSTNPGAMVSRAIQGAR